MPGRRSPHTAGAMLVGHPAADTIRRVPPAAVIGEAMQDMDMAGVVAHAQPAAGAGAVTVAIGEPLHPAVDTTMALAAAAGTIIGRLLHPAVVIGRRAAPRAAGTRISQAELKSASQNLNS